MATVAFYTLGCKVNQYDTQTMIDQFRAKGYEVVDFATQADVYVINTCTVTHTGDQKSRQMIRKAHRRNPQARIVVAGCYAQLDAKTIAALPGVTHVVGTVGPGVAELVDSNVSRVICLDEGKEESRVFVHSGGSTKRQREFLKIQDGCEQFCSYCIVPYARGRSRSVAPEMVLQQVQQLVDQGYREIVLTGIHLGSYGADLEPRTHLVPLLRQIMTRICGRFRLRLSSIDPNEISEQLLDLFAKEDRLCPHLHIPLQSGCDSILKAMGRKYTTTDYGEVVATARQRIPGLAVSTDLIVGFPGESDGMFRQSYEFVTRMEFSRMHVFRYSRRQGTAAASFSEQVEASVKEERSREMIKLGQQMQRAFHNSLVGRILQVLIEEATQEKAVGTAGNYARVSVQYKADDQPAPMGSVVPVLIKRTGGESLEGVLAESSR